MKRIVVCFDGTWQQLRQDKLTNIGIIARSIAHTHTLPDFDGRPHQIPQIVIYSQGVGANTNALGEASFLGNAQHTFNRLAGGIFGEGLEDELVQTYLRLAFNFEQGDEIYVFGFSRGAFAARSLVGLINCSGIVSRIHADQAWEAFRLYRTRLPDTANDAQKAEHDQAKKQFRMLYGKGARAADGSRIKTDTVPDITYLGIFDTVGQRGMPDALGWMSKLLNKRYGFHNLRICPNVRSARHAVAIDERRLGFPPTLWDSLDESNAEAQARPGADPTRKYYDQRWFVGTHGDVGGGNGSALSAAPLKWVAEGATLAGLRFYGKHGDDESPLDTALREAGLSFDASISRPSFWKSLSPMNYQIYSRKIWNDKRRPTAEDVERYLDPTVAMRAEAARVAPRYRPAPLRPFSKALRSVAEKNLPPDELRPPK
jgi:uncharacterized protein (DUF2235 family)